MTDRGLDQSNNKGISKQDIIYTLEQGKPTFSERDPYGDLINYAFALLAYYNAVVVNSHLSDTVEYYAISTEEKLKVLKAIERDLENVRAEHPEEDVDTVLKVLKDSREQILAENEIE